MSKISEMSPDELRIKCAEKMGWKIERCDTNTNIEGVSSLYFVHPFFGKIGTINCEAKEATKEIKSMKLSNYPDYATDRNALQTLIEAVPKHKHSEFIVELKRYALGNRALFLDSVLAYDLLTADPLAVMRAFLEVME